MIMDYVAAAAHFSRPRNSHSTVVVEALRRAIQKLHADDLVFGDLREPNVLVSGQSVMLVDFDWCGKAGEARHPSDVNLADRSIS